MTNSKNMHKKLLLQFDYYTGFIRGWGLILYSTLPASLAILGVLEINIEAIEFRIEYLFISLIPVIVLYLLILKRYHSWFIERRHLHIRTSITLAIIISLTTALCGLSLVVKDNYSFILGKNGLEGLILSFLMAISSLVISSALFMIILTKETDLPGLPNVKIIDLIGEIKLKIKSIQNEINAEPLTEDNLENVIATIEPLSKNILSNGQLNYCLSIRYELDSFQIELDNLINELNTLILKNGYEKAESIKQISSEIKNQSKRIENKYYWFLKIVKKNY